VFPGPVANGSAVAGAGTGYIIVSAHYDHMRPRRSGDDKIYNGADDNASGIAGMLAVARAMKACSAAGQGPACTVIFIAFNGEEAGLLGSMAYAKSPTVPLAEIRGVFNMDMISRGPVRQIYIDGGEIGAPVTAALRSANEAIGLKLRTDEHPDWLDRSDQGPFLAKKVPAVLFSVEDHEDYHQVTDEVAKIDASLAAEVAQLVALAAIDMSRQAFVPRVAVPAANPGFAPTPAKTAPVPTATPAAPSPSAPPAPTAPHAP
jgi:Zn-dependent M28 family amino/carboxypeptidase